MRISSLIAIVVLTILMVGNGFAEQLPITNGDFEVAQPDWGKNPSGWDLLAFNAGFQIPQTITCPDEGPTAIMYSGATNVNATLAFIQTTDNVIESGHTYAVSMDVGTGGLYTLNPEYPLSSVALVLNAQPATGAAVRLGAVQAVDADFTGNDQWNTYSFAYVADSTYAGYKLQVYVQFVGKDYGPFLDSVRLHKTSQYMLLSPLVDIVFENPLSGTNQASYSIALDGQPASNVTVNISSSDPNVVLSDSALTFTDSAWNLPQTVTATMANQVYNTTPTRVVTITNTTTSSDPEFNALAPAEFAITVYNDDVAGMIINPGDGLVVDEEGPTSDTYTVQLLAPPSDTVTVTPVAGDPAAITFDAPLSFTTGLWYEVKTITVTAIDDSIQQQVDHYSSIDHEITGSDAGYTALVPEALSATIHDNDCGAWGWLVGDFSGGGVEEDGRPIGDCRVDLQDIAYFVNQWLDCTIPYVDGCIDAR